MDNFRCRIYNIFDYRGCVKGEKAVQKSNAYNVERINCACACQSYRRIYGRCFACKHIERLCGGCWRHTGGNAAACYEYDIVASAAHYIIENLRKLLLEEWR